MVKQEKYRLRRYCSGFSLLELVVSILIIMTLMAIGYSRFEELAEDVERVSFEGVRNNIQAQLTLKVAYWYAEQHQVSSNELVQINPMELVQHRPSNYGGEVSFEGLKSGRPERWYFVTDKHWLVYKAKRTAQLNNRFERVEIIPFQITLSFQPSGRGRGIAIGAKLEPLYEFHWQAG